MKSYGIIYKITNKINGKCYIGQTTETLQSRWDRHYFSATKKNKGTIKFHNAIRKYGKRNFITETICNCYSLKELNETEVSMIKKYNSHINNGGYNMTYGGEGSVGRKHTEKSKEIISKKAKERLSTKENNPMFGRIGEQNPWYGKKHTEETKRKMSINMKGIKRSLDGCKNISISKLGKKHTEETKRKLSVVHKGIGNGNAKNYKITFPNGETKNIRCLKIFCQENNLDYFSTKYHTYSKTPYKNYIIERV